MGIRNHLWDDTLPGPAGTPVYGRGSKRYSVQRGSNLGNRSQMVGSSTSGLPGRCEHTAGRRAVCRLRHLHNNTMPLIDKYASLVQAEKQ